MLSFHMKIMFFSSNIFIKFILKGHACLNPVAAHSTWHLGLNFITLTSVPGVSLSTQCYPRRGRNWTRPKAKDSGFCKQRLLYNLFLLTSLLILPSPGEQRRLRIKGMKCMHLAYGLAELLPFFVPVAGLPSREDSRPWETLPVSLLQAARRAFSSHDGIFTHPGSVIQRLVLSYSDLRTSFLEGGHTYALSSERSHSCLCILNALSW